MKNFFTLFLILLSFSLFATDKVIYGEDNRTDVYASTNSVFVEYSRSTAAMVHNMNMRPIGKNVVFRTASLEDRGICAKERFSHQPTSAGCSGFLIADNVLVTAGHCIKTMNDCRSNKWVFDYKVDNAEQKRIQVPTSSVYGCKKIISRSMNETNMNDFAVIQLDRKVKDRKPLAIRRQGQPEINTPLVVIGHPSGLPTKIADGARIRSLSETFFVANLDTYGGNSGSAVINVDTGEVEGILVRGEEDYLVDPALKCKVSNVCPADGCRGEDVTFIKSASFL